MIYKGSEKYFGDVTVYSDSRGNYVAGPKEVNGRKIVPSINIYANSIPEAYELALMSVWRHGIDAPTHYDREGDPPSKEATVIVNIFDPFAEPRIHKNFPGGPYELESYRQEVVNGIHNHLINPNEGKWTYTYHDRLFSYKFSRDLKAENMGHLFNEGINQIEDIKIELARDMTSKAAQATTWNPGADIKLPGDRPCLQRLWERAYPDGEGYSLNLNTHWRSRDLYRAWFMNVYAITDLQRKIAEDLSDRINKPVKVGGYIDISDSLHIYGSCFKEMESEFNKMMNAEDIEKRTYTSNHPAFKMMTEEARENLAKDPDFYLKGDSK